MTLSSPIKGIVSRPRLALCVCETLHGKRDPLLDRVDRQDTNSHCLANFHNRKRICYEPVCHFRDVNEAVLVHTDINECPERRYIPDNACQHHTFPEVRDLQNVGKKLRLCQLGPGIEARILQSGYDI